MIWETQPMRILMVVPHYPFPVVGGLERQAHELAKVLVIRGHTVQVLSSQFAPRQKTIDKVDGVLVHRLRWFEFKYIRFLLLPFFLAFTLFRLKNDVDVVHVHNISWFGGFVVLIAKLLSLPVLTKLPNIGYWGIPGIQQRPLGNLLIHVLKCSDAMVAMTPESISELTQIAYPLQQILRASNGIAIEANIQVKREKLASGPVNVIFVGRLSPEKLLLDLLYTWADIRACTPCDCKLRIVGSGPQLSELSRVVHTLDIASSVEFCGYSSDVPAELALADIFVLPSAAEGNSNAILEAMCAGLPIIASCVGGAPEQVGSAGKDYLFTPGDRKILATLLLKLIEDKALREQLGLAMRKRIESNFTIDRIATIYEDAYRLLKDGKRQQIGQLNPGLFTHDSRILIENAH